MKLNKTQQTLLDIALEFGSGYIKFGVKECQITNEAKHYGQRDIDALMALVKTGKVKLTGNYSTTLENPKKGIIDYSRCIVFVAA